jgi:hypothetical protein
MLVFEAGLLRGAPLIARILLITAFVGIALVLGLSLPWPFFAVALLGLAVGVGYFWYRSGFRVWFDSTEGLLIIEQQVAFERRTRAVRLTEIEAVLVEQRDTNSEDGTFVEHRLSLRLLDGTRMPISEFTAGRASLYAEAREKLEAVIVSPAA